MNETDWMYDSLTERFGENLGERQKVVDALLIAKSIIWPDSMDGSNINNLFSVARFILDEWGKCSDAEDPEESGDPVVLDISTITTADISRMKCGTHTFPEGSRWKNVYGRTLIFTDGKFRAEGAGTNASTLTRFLPFTRIKEEN